MFFCVLVLTKKFNSTERSITAGPYSFSDDSSDFVSSDEEQSPESMFTDCVILARFLFCYVFLVLFVTHVSLFLSFEENFSINETHNPRYSATVFF